MSIYDRIWERKLDGGHADPWADTGSRWVAASGLVPTGDRLLDIGVGDGGFAQRMIGRVNHVFGIDVSPRAIEASAQRGIDAYTCDLDRERAPFPDAYFDVITCLDVIEHVADPRILIDEAHRLLAPGGTLILSTVNIRYVKFLASLVVAGRFPRTSGDDEGYDGGHIHFFTSTDLKRLAVVSGLRPEKTLGMIPNNRLAILRSLAQCWLVREFLSAGIVMSARKRRKAE